MAGKEVEPNEYRSEMQKAMAMLAEDSRTIFLGQTVAFP